MDFIDSDFKDEYLVVCDLRDIKCNLQQAVLAGLVGDHLTNVEDVAVAIMKTWNLLDYPLQEVK